MGNCCEAQPLVDDLHNSRQRFSNAQIDALNSAGNVDKIIDNEAPATADRPRVTPRDFAELKTYTQHDDERVSKGERNAYEDNANNGRVLNDNDDDLNNPNNNSGFYSYLNNDEELIEFSSFNMYREEAQNSISSNPQQQQNQLPSLQQQAGNNAKAGTNAKPFTMKLDLTRLLQNTNNVVQQNVRDPGLSRDSNQHQQQQRQSQQQQQQLQQQDAGEPMAAPRRPHENAPLYNQDVNSGKYFPASSYSSGHKMGSASQYSSVVRMRGEGEGANSQHQSVNINQLFKNI